MLPRMSQENIDLVKSVIDASERGEMHEVFRHTIVEIEWRISDVRNEYTDLSPSIAAMSQRMRGRASGIEQEWIPTPKTGRSTTGRWSASSSS